MIIKADKGKRYAAGLLAALMIAALCACGRKDQETDGKTDAAPSAPESESSATSFPAPESTAEVSNEGSSASGEGPEEDPWAEGYYYDEALTRELWERFATENTNDTDESRLTCTMTQDFLDELDRRAGLWLYEGISDRETEQAMRALSFRFPRDAPETERGLKSVRAGIYSFAGRDPDGLAARVRLGNTEACFYLFLRAYYSPAEERTRIYMINGLVW